MSADPAETGTTELLPLALSRPYEALDRARCLLAGGLPPFDASLARQAIGIVLREFGDIDAAVRELRAARRLARASESTEREDDVLATLGVALVFAGRTTSGRNALNAAAQRSTGLLRGRILLRRGGVLLALGRHRAALADLNSAIAVLRLEGDLLWEARALTERAFCSLALGSVRPAVTDLGRAEELFARTGQELESVDATMHRGVLALRIGDLPVALSCFDTAAERFARLGASDPTLSIHRCAALLAAGLAEEALDEADAEIARLERVRGSPLKRAELLLTAAEGALAAGRPAAALDRAGTAARLFDRQRRPWWRAHARLVKIRAQFAAGPPSGALLRDAARCARELAALSSPRLPLSRLVAGQVALALGRTAVAEEHLSIAARARRRGPALSRTAGWLAEALRAEAVGDHRRLMHACRRGLEVINEHRATLGSSELRAQATAHGAELARLAQRHALRLNQPRLLLSWSERWRAGALAVPPVRPPDDEELQADLAAMRVVTSRLAEAQARGLPIAALRHEQLRLERAARARALRAQGGDRTVPFSFDLSGVREELGDGRLLELVDVDGELHVLVCCGAGRVRRCAAGRTEQVARQVDLIRFGLSRLAHGRSTLTPEQLLAQLDGAGRALERLLLGDAARFLGDREIVIVPPGRLQAVPWALLPSLRDRVVSVAPSAASWLRARRSEAKSAGVALVRGPGLPSEGAEVPRIAREFQDSAGSGRFGRGERPIVLGDGTATVARVLEAMDGARLVHVAAHGVFRTDSPLFSSLRVDDGPLTVYDLERLRQAPQQVVLSSCDSGRTYSAGADELLGLAVSLMQLGTTGIVASVVPVNDVAVVPLMVALHRELRAGASLPAGLRNACRATADDPVTTAAGWSFLCLGAG
ncbi:CHAT domain-containing protein [Nonomuraea basaltis]|uniref:CHAT domain-containing protein n=1 Tax=Nonomuraea basaltis TaxID=2495887 RepID=UPI00110C65A8|nr:CHAT domain-containing protein [Nonomuraea basaltis]TMR94509.1 CHAT domain-containing protein [Nonomuraea basaltis]